MCFNEKMNYIWIRKREDYVPEPSSASGSGRVWRRSSLYTLNAMIERETEQEGDAHMGSMQLLNALRAKHAKELPQSKGLMYVEAKVNGISTKAMVETSSTYNFVSVNEASRLKLYTSKEAGWLKAINFTTNPLLGIAREATMRIGPWEGKVDFTVTHMDDFKVVLGMDFLRHVKVVPISFLRSVAILEE